VSPANGVARFKLAVSSLFSLWFYAQMFLSASEVVNFYLIFGFLDC
jgi:hypothetical protein